jgi:heme-degrading monooxygenase HmoA
VVLEVAVLQMRSDETPQFEAAFREAEPLIASAVGFLSLELQKCLEVPDRYLLLARWTRHEDHTVGFRGSPAYREWKRLLHHSPVVVCTRCQSWPESVGQGGIVIGLTLLFALWIWSGDAGRGTATFCLIPNS